jgi:CubicO group peptidase (beta-lactamase class C family)
MRTAVIVASFLAMAAHAHLARAQSVSLSQPDRMSTTFAAAVVGTQADQTDDFIRAQMQQQNIPGLSLVVLKDGEIIKSAGYGLANISLKIPATPETVYHIASMPRTFLSQRSSAK